MGLANFQSVDETKDRPKRGGLSKMRVKGRLEKDIVKLERDLDVQQSGSLIERAAGAVLGNPFISNTLDIISRPNYAVAGAVEEIASSRGFGSALGRIGREMFSGAFGLQGDKQGFSEVMGDLGVGEGPSISSIAPFLFNKTGEGPRFQRGGLFDVTGRGAIGLALDIVLDPLTYLTFGTAPTARGAVKVGTNFLSDAGKKVLASEMKKALASGLEHGAADAAARAAVELKITKGASKLADQGGVKMFGQTIIPGEVINKPARTVKDGVVKFLHKSSLGEGIIEVGEGLGRVFDRDFRVRKMPEYIAMKDMYLSTMDYAQREFADTVSGLFRGTNGKQRAAITEFIDSGKITALPNDLPGARHIVSQMEDILQDFAIKEQEVGLLDTVHTNYILHAYKENPARVKDILARLDAQKLKASLQGSQKKRTIRTLAQARAIGLTPVDDAADLMRRRGMRHIHATYTNKFFTDVRDKFGISALDDSLESGAEVISEMNKIAKLTEQEAAAVKKASRRGVPVEEIRSLSDNGKKVFLRDRFNRVTSALENERTINKYKEFSDLFPETTDRKIQELPSFHGEPMARINDIREFKGVALPEKIAEDIQQFNRHFINRDEVKGLLKAYDKFMNTFKVGVTSIFPAFHFRNHYSNIVQQFTDVGLSALNPQMHIDAVRMLAGDVNGSFLASHGRRWGYGEVVYEANRRGVLADYRNIFETFGDKIPVRTSKGIGDIVKHPIDSWKRFGGIIENEARLTLFTNYLRRGLDPGTASSRVNQILFDYKKLSKVERDVLARVFPFYRWTRKNIALQAERLVRNPGQAATQAKLTRNNRTDPELLPAYLRGDFVFTLEDDDKGNISYIRGLDLPIKDLEVISEPLRTITTNLAPIPKMIFEIGNDKEFFSGRTISEDSRPLIKQIGQALDLLPAGAKKKIDFSKKKRKDGTIEYRMDPLLTYVLIKSWAISRLYGTADRVLRSKSLVSSENFFDVTTGMRLQDVDIDTAARKLSYEYREVLEKEAVAKGIRRRLRGTYKPKER